MDIVQGMLHRSARDTPAYEADVIGDCSGELAANFVYPIVALIIDAFSLTADNGDDIIVVSPLAEWVRGRAGAFDAERNLTVMLEKGLAISSAGLACLALFRMVRVRVNTNRGDFFHWWVFAGLLFGGTLPCELVMPSNESVENATDVLLKECMVRFPRGIPPPAVVNWVTRRLAIPVKNPRQCVSCWRDTTTN